jgi:hypothetical protein
MRAVAVEQRTRGEVLRRRGGDADVSGNHPRLMPPDLRHLIETLCLQPCTMPFGNEQPDRIEIAQRPEIEMIIMRVREQHGVDRRKIGKSARRRNPAAQHRQWQRRTEVTEDRIDQKRGPAALKKKRRVPEPHRTPSV